MRFASHTPAVVLASLALASAAIVPAPAQAQQGTHISVSDTTDVTTIVPRVPLRHARAAAITTNGHTAIVLHGDKVVLQLTDAGLHHVNRDIREDTASGLGPAIVRAMVAGGIMELLDRGVAYPVDSLGAARYEGGELVLEDRQGNRMFEGVNVNGTKVMQAFPKAEGRRFAAAVREEMRRRGR